MHLSVAESAGWLKRHAGVGVGLLLATFLVTTVLHVRGFGGDFLSDDFVHAIWIFEAQSSKSLLEWLIQRFFMPLESGNFAYRPVAFVSYAVDWLMFETRAWGWHLSNFLIHVINSGLVLIFAGRLAKLAKVRDVRFAAAAAAALFLAIPFAGETTFWPVGRFDLLVATFSLAFLTVFLTGGGRSHGWTNPAALIFLILALLSKESAMPIFVVAPLLVFMAAWSKEWDAMRSRSTAVLAALAFSIRRIWPIMAIAAGYLAWRFFLFGSAWKVYPASQPPQSIADAWERVRVLEHALPTSAGIESVVWVSSAALMLLMILVGLLKNRNSNVPQSSLFVVTLLLIAGGLALAPATSFPVMTSNGEGLRNLYLPWMYASVGFGLALSIVRFGKALLPGFLILALWGQWRTLEAWHLSALEMWNLAQAVPSVAENVDESSYALLLLPDHVGRVPFARNAQGAIVIRPRQERSFLHKLAVFTPLQFEEWERKFTSNVIGRLKGDNVVFDRSGFDAVYCWAPSRKEFIRLQSRPVAGDAFDWEYATLAEAGMNGCMIE